MSCSKEEECFSTFFLMAQGLDFSTYTSSLLLFLFYQQIAEGAQ